MPNGTHPDQDQDQDQIESGHDRNNGPSSAGAVGPRWFGPRPGPLDRRRVGSGLTQTRGPAAPNLPVLSRCSDNALNLQRHPECLGEALVSDDLLQRTGLDDLARAQKQRVSEMRRNLST
jgi:hypothetical protein